MTITLGAGVSRDNELMTRGGSSTARRPAAIADRPLPVVDLVDGAFAALRQRPRTLITVVAGLVVPIAIAEGYLARNALGGATLEQMINDPTVANEVSTQSPFGSEALLAYLLDWFLMAVAGVPVSRVVAGWVTGQDVSAGQALAFTARRWWVILVAFLLNHLIQTIGFAMFLVPGAIAVALFALTSPVIAVEELGPVAALKRSAELVRRRKATVIGGIAMTAAVAYGVENAVSLLPTMVALIFGPDKTWPLVSASAMMTSIILVPFTSATMCLVYLDIRFRTEGLDLELRSWTVLKSPDDASG